MLITSAYSYQLYILCLHNNQYLLFQSYVSHIFDNNILAVFTLIGIAVISTIVTNLYYYIYCTKYILVQSPVHVNFNY